jgi:DNA-binding Lrp family transcriptional regulator
LISDEEKRVLTAVQRLPVTPEPFSEIADRLGMTEEALFSMCRSFLDRGIIKRFGPSISHRKLGFSANPMTVMKVPDEQLVKVGTEIAKSPHVTHCYTRTGWDYNLFFMVHGRTREESLKKAQDIVTAVGDFEYRCLFSTEELKKTSFVLPEKEGEDCI